MWSFRINCRLNSRIKIGTRGRFSGGTPKEILGATAEDITDGNTGRAPGEISGKTY